MDNLVPNIPSVGVILLCIVCEISSEGATRDGAVFGVSGIGGRGVEGCSEESYGGW